MKALIILLFCVHFSRGKSNTTYPEEKDDEPSYPEFYQVTSEEHAVQAIVGYYRKMGTLHENFPSYQKTDENFVLKLGDSGHWEITATEDVAYALIQSRTKSMIAPPNNHLWQYRSSSSTWLDDPSFTIQPLVYPEAYCLKYSGNNETVEDILAGVAIPVNLQ